MASVIVVWKDAGWEKNFDKGYCLCNEGNAGSVEGGETEPQGRGKALIGDVIESRRLRWSETGSYKHLASPLATWKPRCFGLFRS